jgi:hypothetical protein
MRGRKPQDLRPFIEALAVDGVVALRGALNASLHRERGRRRFVAGYVRYLALLHVLLPTELGDRELLQACAAVGWSLPQVTREVRFWRTALAGREGLPPTDPTIPKQPREDLR